MFVSFMWYYNWQLVHLSDKKKRDFPNKRSLDLSKMYTFSGDKFKVAPKWNFFAKG